MRNAPVELTRQPPLALRAVKKCLIFLVLGAIMGWMLLRGLCARRKRGAC